MLQKLTVSVGLLLSWSLLGVAYAGSTAAPLDGWIASETSLSTTYMMRNVSPPGAAAGSVIASPSQSNPDYYYHWIRDASITMDAVVNLYVTTSGATRTQYYNTLLDYVDFSRRNQMTPNPSGNPQDTGLGEPKFNVDGSAFTGSWGRPRTTAPRFARSL